MQEIVSDAKLVAHCGLYCGACGAYLKGRCPGCHGNAKASWCKVRTCNIDNNQLSCAECKSFDNVRDCKKYNNPIARLFGFLFRSDRAKCIAQIKQLGIQCHADIMAEQRRQSCRR